MEKISKPREYKSLDSFFEGCSFNVFSHLNLNRFLFEVCLSGERLKNKTPRKSRVAPVGWSRKRSARLCVCFCVHYWRSVFPARPIEMHVNRSSRRTQMNSIFAWVHVVGNCFRFKGAVWATGNSGQETGGGIATHTGGSTT